MDPDVVVAVHDGGAHAEEQEDDGHDDDEDENGFDAKYNYDDTFEDEDGYNKTWFRCSLPNRDWNQKVRYFRRH